MLSVSYVFMILMPFHGSYQVIGAETYTGFRKCMVQAENYNYRTERKTFAVCMPIVEKK